MVLENSFLEQYVEAMISDYRSLIVPALAEKDYKKAQTELENYMSTFTRDTGALFDRLPLGLVLIVSINQLYKYTRAAAAGGEPVSKKSIDMVTAYLNQSMLHIKNLKNAA